MYVFMIGYCIFSIKSNAEFLLGMQNIAALSNGNLYVLYGNDKSSPISITGPWSLLTNICSQYTNTENITGVTFVSNSNNTQYCTFNNNDVINENKLYNTQNQGNRDISNELLSEYGEIVTMYNAIVVFVSLLIVITMLSSSFRIYDLKYNYNYIDGKKWYAVANFIDMIVYHVIKFIMLIIFVGYIYKNNNFISEIHRLTNDDTPQFVKELFSTEFTILYVVIILNALSSMCQLIQKFAKHAWGIRNPREGYVILRDKTNNEEI